MDGQMGGRTKGRCTNQRTDEWTYEPKNGRIDVRTKERQRMDVHKRTSSDDIMDDECGRTDGQTVTNLFLFT